MKTRCQCGQEYDVDQKDIGCVATCEKCGKDFTIEQSRTSLASASPVQPPAMPVGSESKPPKKKMHPLLSGCLWVAGGMLLVCIAIPMMAVTSVKNERNSEKPAPVVKTPEQLAQEARNDKIHKMFNPFTGEHYELVKFVKKNMKDPDSFKHSETAYKDNKEYITIKMVYRGKNSFGGYVVGTIWANSDIDGNIVKIVSQE